MKLNRSTQAVCATGVAIAVAVSAGCGAGNKHSSSTTAGAFVKRVTVEFARGQTGLLWDSLLPGDQAVVSRARYMGCESNEGFDLKNFKVLQTYPDKVVVAGRQLRATAVSVRVTSEDGVTTATMHAVRDAGNWHWLLSQRDHTAYKNGACPRD
jgi:hypothetical protein